MVAPNPTYLTKSQIVFDTLRSRIVHGELPPKTRLVLRKISEEFWCSEIPVREAITSLAAIGLVQIVPHTGATVTEIDQRKLVEFTEIRLLIEPTATALAAKRMSKEAVEALYDLLTRMQRFVSQEDFSGYGKLNREFHEMIIENCENQQLIDLIRKTRDETARGRMLFRLSHAYLARSLNQHRQIVDAIDSGQFDVVYEITKEHCRDVLDATRQLTSLGSTAKPIAG